MHPLLIPRYKVIADWPGMEELNIDDIVTGHVIEIGPLMFRPDAYPHLFSLLLTPPPPPTTNHI